MAGASPHLGRTLVGKPSPPPILGLCFAFCHMGPFLGSTSVVFKASLRQSMWTRCSAQCLAPHQHPINAYFVLSAIYSLARSWFQLWVLPAAITPQVGAPGTLSSQEPWAPSTHSPRQSSVPAHLKAWGSLDHLSLASGPRTSIPLAVACGCPLRSPEKTTLWLLGQH